MPQWSPLLFMLTLKKKKKLCVFFAIIRLLCLLLKLKSSVLITLSICASCHSLFKIFIVFACAITCVWVWGGGCRSPHGEVRGQPCGSVLSFHLYVASRDGHRLSSALPTKSFHWLSWGALPRSPWMAPSKHSPHYNCPGNRFPHRLPFSLPESFSSLWHKKTPVFVPPPHSVCLFVSRQGFTV